MAVELRCACLWVMIFALSGCTSSPQQGSLDVPSSRVAVVTPTHLLPTSEASVVTTPTVQPTKTVLTADWTTVSWQGFIIPIPPNAAWQPLPTDAKADAVAPIVARGAVTYPMAQGVVELPYGPIFTMYTFSGSLEEWLTLQQQRNANAIDSATVHDTTLAFQPAKGYQPVIIGLCNAGLYITKADAAHLLEIYTECIDSGIYPSVVSQLRVQTP